ncbi:MAG: hypothetical protein ACJAQT_002358 [Akkermansiaceae bacterium]
MVKVAVSKSTFEMAARDGEGGAEDSFDLDFGFDEERLNLFRKSRVGAEGEMVIYN